MINFEEFRKNLTDFCTYYQIPINSLVVAGHNASELNNIYSTHSKEYLINTKKLTNTIAIFITRSSFINVQAHFTTKSKQRSIVTLTLGRTEFVIFEQSSPLDIKVLDNIKFLNKKAVREFRYGVPEKYKHF